jgi:hypothetical protein
LKSIKIDHKKFSGVAGRLQDVDESVFRCSTGIGAGIENDDDRKDFMLDLSDKLKFVDRFCSLGDMIKKGEGVEEASRCRLWCAWGKFNELTSVLTMIGASLL